MSTITTLRPNGQASNASWTIGGGAGSTNAATSDNSDTTYILSPTVPNKVVALTLDDIGALGANTYRPRVRIRVRAARATAADPDNLVVWLTDSSGTFIAGMDVMISGTTVTTYTGGWYYPPTGAKGTSPGFSQSALNDYRLRTYVRRGPNATQNLAVRVHELYLDVENNDLPVTTVVGPTGTVLTTDKPEITLAATDTEGDAITGYYIEVKTANATGPGPTGGGTTLWSSGEVEVGDASNVTVTCGTALPRDIVTGYEVYAYTFHTAPGGGKVSSAYATGATFFVDPAQVPPPEVVSSTAIDGEGVPLYKLTAISRINLMSFTDSTLDASIGTWVSTGTGSNIAYENAAGTTDAHRMRCFRSGSTGTITAVCTGSLSLGVGAASKLDHTGAAIPVSMVASVRTSSTPRNAQLILICRDNALNTLATLTSVATPDTAGNFTQLSLTGNVPAATTLFSPRVQFTSVPVGEDHYVDDIAVHYGSNPVFSIGGRANSSFGVLPPRMQILDINSEMLDEQDLLTIDALTVYYDDYNIKVGVTKDYLIQNITRDDLVTSQQAATAVGPHVGLSGWWLHANDKDPFPVNLVGNTFDTEHWEDAAEFMPLGRMDTVTITDGGKLPRRSFVFEVFDNDHAEILRNLYVDSGGHFWLAGTWPAPETACYRAQGPINESSENTDPDRFVFSCDAQMIGRL